MKNITNFKSWKQNNNEDEGALLSNNKQFLFQQLIWIGISFGISLAISFFVPFPYSLVIIMAVFILLSFYMRKRAMNRMGMSGTTTMFGSNTLNYYCMSCGTKHNQASCPKCGSKMKRVGTWYCEWCIDNMINLNNTSICIL